MKFVFNFIKNFLLGFLLTWYAVDLWKLFNGDMRPLWRKGINIEWLVNTKYDEKTAFVNNSQGESHTYIGFKVSYTYSEPNIKRTE